jgi:hypothetical protein
VTRTASALVLGVMLALWLLFKDVGAPSRSQSA